MTEAYSQGAEAASANINYEANPHSLGTQQRVDWFEGWMSVADYGISMMPEYAHYDAYKAAWTFVGNVNSPYTGKACQGCGRIRVHLCANGKHICEKCHFCPEDGTYSPPPF